VLTVEQLLGAPELDVSLSAGAAGVGNRIAWITISELRDPTPWLEGGELVLTTGLGIGRRDQDQRRYLRRLDEHGLAGMGFGLGFGYKEVPPALVAEADRLGFPIVAVPYAVPFIALTKAAFAHLASERLELLTDALAVQERLAQALVDGRSVDEMLAILCESVGCGLQLVDRRGRVVAERHHGRRTSFEKALELPVVCGDEIATLRAARKDGRFGDFDMLVLHHAQTALAFELSRRRAVSAAELRLAGDLLEDLEHDRLDDREIARRIAAFGFEPGRSYAALLAVPVNGTTGDHLRERIAQFVDGLKRPYLSTARPETAAFLIGANSEEEALQLAARIAEAEPEARLGVGRPATGRGLGRSLVEARAALDAATSPVASFHDLGSLALLLGLPDAVLEAFVDRVLGPAAKNEALVESVGALLDAGCRWSEAAAQLGVHRHTLRYRMERLQEQTGLHPADPDTRMDLWLAVKALRVLETRSRQLEPAGAH
jgi:DNA-binding PucR family transcriptional regulator